MSTPFATHVATRLTDEELVVNDGMLKDGAVAQQRARPVLRVLGTHRRHRVQNFVVLGEGQERPIEFDEFHDYATSSIRLDGTEESLRMMLRIIGVLESEGHHFVEMKPKGEPPAKALIRDCLQTPVLIYAIEVMGNEPEL